LYGRKQEEIMELLAAIHTRQSVSRVRPDPLPQALIERLLDAAVQAPNHFHNRPWRFVVLTGQARQRLGEVLVQSLLQRVPDALHTDLDLERSRPLRAPVLIAVGIDKPDQPKVSEIENICAGAAAVENLLLAAHDLGLGAMWRTGGAAVDPAVKAFLGFAPDQHIIAIVYVGYPDGERVPPVRPSFADRVTWLSD
jgi:nitroreductase